MQIPTLSLRNHVAPLNPFGQSAKQPLKVKGNRWCSFIHLAAIIPMWAKVPHTWTTCNSPFEIQTTRSPCSNDVLPAAHQTQIAAVIVNGNFLRDVILG